MSATEPPERPGGPPEGPPQRPEFGEDWLVAVLDSLDEAVIALDGDGRFVAANPSAEDLLGFVANEVRGWPFHALGWDETDPVGAIDPVAATLADGRARRHVLVRLVRDGDRQWLRVNTTILPLQSGESRSGVVVSLTDVTGEVVSQEALREYAEELERVNEELRRADAMKSDFLAMASHELRTPLASLIGFAGVLSGDWGLLDEDDRRRCLDAIDTQGHRLLHVVDALLTAARMEAGDLTAEPVPTDVRTIVQDAIQRPGRETDIDVRLAQGLRVLVDPDHGRRMIAALVNNAEVHGDPPIVVQAELTAATVELRVCDSGPGVNPAFVPRLFERFAQASTGTTRRAAGVGLGLAIASGLARLNEGTLDYEDNDPSGACFVLRLPAVLGSP